MITEDYVSYEVAKLLKEKGFDGEIHTTFDEEGYTQPSITHQIAMKWLREVHGVFIYIKPWLRYWGVDCARYKEHRFVLEGYVPHVFSIDDPKEYKSIDKYCVPTYEEACESALKYSLENLI